MDIRRWLAAGACALTAAAADGQIIVGLGEGAAPTVSVWDPFAPSAPLASFAPYDASFTGGVRVATGDVTGDGKADIVTGPGPGGGPHVKVFSGLSGGAATASFPAYTPSFTGGVYVAAGDVDGDGVANIITGGGAGGGPHVKVFSGGGSEVSSWFAYDPSFIGGVRVSAGDVNRNGQGEIITGPGPGGIAQIKSFSVAGVEERSLLAFDPAFSGGVYVASGDVDGDGFDDFIAGAASGGAPQINVYSGATGDLLESMLAFDPSFTGGVRVAAADVNRDGFADIVAGPGPGGLPEVRVYSGADGSLLSSFLAADRAFSGGVYVAAIPAPSSCVLLAPAALWALRRRR